MVGSVVGWVQVVGVWFLAMSGISEPCKFVSVVGWVQVVGVWFLAMSGISEPCKFVCQFVSVVSLFRWLGSGSWPCLASQNFVCWAVL